MNASQRRIARRQVLTALPVKTQVATPTGSIASVIGVTLNAMHVLVKLKNNATKQYRPGQLKLV